MIARDRPTLPEDVGGLFDFAFSIYGRRIGLYAGVAFGGLVIQAVAALVVSQAPTLQSLPSLLPILNVVVDAIIIGIVSIGMFADVATNTPLTTRQIVAATSERLPLLLCINLIVSFAAVLAPADVSASEIGFAVFTLPLIAVFFGALGFATVIAAVEPSSSPFISFVRSFGMSLRVSLVAPNFGRTAILGAGVLCVLLMEVVLRDQLKLRGVHGYEFWANIPLDALVVGPLQALFTVFYLDFKRRIEAAARN